MLQSAVRAPIPVEQWIEGLASFSAAGFSQQAVQQYILDHAISPESAAPYTFFSHRHYTRNLIYRNDLFECLTIGWESGQSSAIHDHNDRLGWMYLVSGRLAVYNYAVEDRDTTHPTCRLVATGETELDSGHAAVPDESAACVDHEAAVHQVCNLERFHARAISIHVYQRPMTHCEVYSQPAENGQASYRQVELQYTSMFGKLLPGVTL